jgi:hypothetical protein
MNCWLGFWPTKSTIEPNMRLPAPLPILCAAVAAVALLFGCGAKGPPVPRRRHPPAQCQIRATGIRTLEAKLPTEDTMGNRLSGVEAVRVYYLQMESGFPSPMDVFQRGEAVLERRLPDLPAPGKTVTLNLSNFGRPKGWLVVVPFRVGNVPGVPSEVLPWVDPAF